VRPRLPRPPGPKPPHLPDPGRIALAAASCLALRGKAGGQGDVTAADADSGQMAGTISSSGSSGQSPGSSSGTAS
jgi:hypothetical protein